MPRYDEIDALLAKHFAWSFAPPDAPALVDAKLAAAQALAAALTVPAPSEKELVDPDAAAMEEALARARVVCEPLAVGIAAAWSEADEEKRWHDCKRLLVRATRLGNELGGMLAWPVESVRLLRLFVKMGPRMTRRQRERAAQVTSLMPLEDPEMAELLVEVARAGDADLCSAIFADDEWIPEVGDEDSLVARLADIVDDGPTHAARAIAIDLLGEFAPRPSGVFALARALRLPSFMVRARALQVLTSNDPCLLGADDLVRVLQDLVAHAPPDPTHGEEHEEDERIFAEAILVALAHIRPEGARDALLDWIDAAYDTLWMDVGWATEALAVGFPETGAIMADHWLLCAYAHDRRKALGALRRLPNELAEPRLRRAAADPVADIRNAARMQWVDRYRTAIVVPPTDLVGGALLEGPPSERFLARLAVMQGRVTDARRAMARALLAEGTDRESLVLLLQILADDLEAAEPYPLRGNGPWTLAILDAFGSLGVQGICAIADRFPEPESFMWTRRLVELVESGVIVLEHAAPLRALAAKHILSEHASEIDDSLRLLGLVGAPPEVLDRVMALAQGDDTGSLQARRLIVAWPDRSSDARLTSDMAMAMAEHDWNRLEHAAFMALERGTPAARVIAQRVLELAESDELAVDAATACVRGLRQHGAVDDAWARATLARPESPLFTAVTRVWRGDAIVRDELEAALTSPARSGAAAAEAAIALLRCEPPWNARDKRLPAILAAARPVERAELVSLMCIRGSPFSYVAPHLEPLLTSPDPRVTYSMQGLLSWLKAPRLSRMLRQLLPRIVDPGIREEIEQVLGEEPPSYWAER